MILVFEMTRLTMFSFGGFVLQLRIRLKYGVVINLHFTITQLILIWLFITEFCCQLVSAFSTIISFIDVHGSMLLSLHSCVAYMCVPVMIEDL